jgi:hypothetical protein
MLKQFLSALSSKSAPTASPSGPAGAAAPEPADIPDYCFACPRCKAVMRKGLLLCLNCYSAFKFREGLSGRRWTWFSLSRMTGAVSPQQYVTERVHQKAYDRSAKVGAGPMCGPGDLAGLTPSRAHAAEKSSRQAGPAW